MLSRQEENVLNSSKKFLSNKENSKKWNMKTPPYNPTTENKHFYDRVNTSPIKVKDSKLQNGYKIGVNNSKDSLVNDENCENDKTVTKKVNKLGVRNFTENNFINDENLTPKDHSEKSERGPQKLINANPFVPGNKFTSTLDANSLKRTLVFPETLQNSKPSLNAVESRNKLFYFTKSKTYLEDEETKLEVTECENNENAYPIEEDEGKEEEENKNNENESDISIYEDPHQMLLNDLKKNLPVPEEKKDDEAFKILKIKEMRKKSLPPFKSVRAVDSYLLSNPKNNFENGNNTLIKLINLDLNYSLVKKKKIVQSAKKVYSSVLTLTTPNPNRNYRFPIYRDNEIGINDYWQEHLIESVSNLY
jgi:hypothetical protein